MNSIKRNLLHLTKRNSIYKISQKYMSTVEVQQRRSELFSLEQQRQKENVGRIEKIEIRYLGQPEDTTLIMNKGLSTPYNCAQRTNLQCLTPKSEPDYLIFHTKKSTKERPVDPQSYLSDLSLMHCNRAALALIDNHTPWDMHRPLQDSCTLQLLNFTMANPELVNRVFWRTCSFMLGAVLQSCFKDEAQLQLHSFPSPNVKTGSFVHDIFINQPSWEASKDELRAIGAEMYRMAAKNLKIERLDVGIDLALEMFKDNPYKKEQLPSILSSSRNSETITVYRVGDHVDISRGPMLGLTGLLGKCNISSVHRLVSEKEGALYRVQGVALPTGFQMNHFAFGILEDRSKKLNPARLPHKPYKERVGKRIA